MATRSTASSKKRTSAKSTAKKTTRKGRKTTAKKAPAKKKKTTATKSAAEAPANQRRSATAVVSGPGLGEVYQAERNEDYMNDEQLEHFRQKLLAWKEEILRIISLI